MKDFSRRTFLQSGALATACAVSSVPPAIAEAIPETGKPCPIKLGLASYTFRNFDRAQLIGFMKQLHLTDLNCKDVKDHLPMDPVAEKQALDDYAAAGIKLH
ncbi:MAG: sugar phosphate isomerase/epimerase, partial [Terracidiphilus sp.]